MRPGGRLSFLSVGAGSSLRGELDRLSRHPNALMLPALAAHAAGYVCGIGSVFKVVTAGCGQRGLQLGRPLLVGLSQPHTWLEVRRRSLSTARNG
jgi:hypothetical protein